MINTNKIIRNILGNNNQKQRKVRQSIKPLQSRRRLSSLSSIELPDKFWMVDFTFLHDWTIWEDVEVKQYTREEFLKEFPKHPDHINFDINYNAALIRYINSVLFIDTPDSATFIHPNKQKAIDVAIKVGINIYFSDWVMKNNTNIPKTPGVKIIKKITSYDIEEFIENVLKPMNLSSYDIKKYVDYLKSRVNKEIRHPYNTWEK